MSYVVSNEEESFTITSPSGVQLAEKLAPWLTPDMGRLIQAMGDAVFDPVLELAEESGTQGEPGWVPGYGKLFNPETCPAEWLSWLAQWVGVEIPTTFTEAEARELVKNQPAHIRGTPAAIEIEIYANTTIERTSHDLRERNVLIERRAVDGTENPWAFGISVAAEDIPSMSALEQGVNRVKPGGVFPWYQTNAKYTWNEAVHAWEEDTMEWSETNKRQP